MSDIINLRRVRKNLARAGAEQKAAEQRLKFGRTKAERAAEEARERQQEKALDGHRLGRRDET